MPNIEEKINVMWLHRITDILNGNESVWTILYTYFMGMTTRAVLPTLAGNRFVHKQRLGPQYSKLKNLFLKYRDKIDLEDKSLKELYYKIIELKDIKSRIELENLGTNFGNVWKNLSHVKNNIHREFLYRTVHKAFPTAGKLKDRGFRIENSNCKFCNQHKETNQHIFLECNQLQHFRQYVIDFCRSDRQTFCLTPNLLLLDNIDIASLPDIYAYVHTIWASRNKENPGLLYAMKNKFHKDKHMYIKYN